MVARIAWSLLIIVAMVTSSLGVMFSPGAAATVQPYVDFHKHAHMSDFAGSTPSGVVVDTRADGSLDIHLAADALQVGADKEFYGVKDYWYGTLESPIINAAYPFDTAIPSWNALTPPGTWVQVELRAAREGHWTKYYNMGIWASGDDTIQRRSVSSQGDADGFVAVDTLLLYGDPGYTQYQYRLSLFTTDPHASSSVSLVSVMTSDSSREPAGLQLGANHDVWGIDLAVPMRSQMIYKGGGEVWCSPTSTSMVLAYWGYRVPVPAAAEATYDAVYDGTGNWPFNAAWAAAYGLEAYVTRLGSMAQVEEWIGAGVPVVISFAFAEGELPGTPIPSSDGHLMVIRGFDDSGNVIANDPAGASDGEVRIVYDRETLERLWLEHSGGTVYLIYPKDHPVPTENAYGSW